MNLILFEPQEIDEDGRATIRDHRAAHIRDVLQAHPGEIVRAGIVDGPKGAAVVERAEDGAVTLHFSADETVSPVPVVDLILAMPRPKILKRLWPQLAALGTGRIIITNARRVERAYWGTHILAPQTYRPLLVEGLMQAQLTRLPQVSICRRFRKLIVDELDGIFPQGMRLLAEPGAHRRIKDAVPGGARGRALIAVGPEGGWSDEEIALLESHGFVRIGLSAGMLRVDTACVALLAVVGEIMS